MEKKQNKGFLFFFFLWLRYKVFPFNVYNHEIQRWIHLALSKNLPVYAIPQAAPRPWPRDPVATSVNACLWKQKDNN